MRSKCQRRQRTHGRAIHKRIRKALGRIADEPSFKMPLMKLGVVFTPNPYPYQMQFPVRVQIPTKPAWVIIHSYAGKAHSDADV